VGRGKDFTFAWRLAFFAFPVNQIYHCSKVSFQRKVQMADSAFLTYMSPIEAFFREGDAKAQEKLEEVANIRLIEKLILAIGRNDLAAAGELLTSDAELDIQTAVELPFILQAKGKEKFLEAVKYNFGELQNQQPNIEAVVAQGNTVILLVREQGELRKTAASYHIQGMQRYVCREGKIALVHELILPV
jgi:ketosteroid isomerase-like protein